jgi:hypothetical protein
MDNAQHAPLEGSDSPLEDPARMWAEMRKARAATKSPAARRLQKAAANKAAANKAAANKYAANKYRKTKLAKIAIFQREVAKALGITTPAEYNERVEKFNATPHAELTIWAIAAGYGPYLPDSIVEEYWQDIRVSAYYSSLEDPSRTPEDNWYLAETGAIIIAGQFRADWRPESY